MDSGSPSIGWGQNSAYPVQEAAYFGNVMRAGSNGKVNAWYCEGRDYNERGSCRGRLGAERGERHLHEPRGAPASSATITARSTGRTATARATASATRSTVWRQASYNPVFDDNYVYKLVNVASRQALDVNGNYTGENGCGDSVVRQTALTNQQFRIIQVATSQWKIVGVPSGKAITDR